MTEFYYNVEDDLQTSDSPASTSQMLTGGMHYGYEILAVKARDCAILASMIPNELHSQYLFKPLRIIRILRKGKWLEYMYHTNCEELLQPMIDTWQFFIIFYILWIWNWN